MDTHIDILTSETSLCMCEVEKTASEFLGVQVRFEPDGNLYIYSKQSIILSEPNFQAFLNYAKSLQSVTNK